MEYIKSGVYKSEEYRQSMKLIRSFKKDDSPAITLLDDSYSEGEIL